MSEIKSNVLVKSTVLKKKYRFLKHGMQFYITGYENILIPHNCWYVNNKDRILFNDDRKSKYGKLIVASSNNLTKIPEINLYQLNPSFDTTNKNEAIYTKQDMVTAINATLSYGRSRKDLTPADILSKVIDNIVPNVGAIIAVDIEMEEVDCEVNNPNSLGVRLVKNNSGKEIKRGYYLQPKLYDNHINILSLHYAD